MTAFDPNHAKWTAYVLGEVTPDEKAALDNEVETNPEAARLVADLRKATEQLESLFAAEPDLTLDPGQTEAIRDTAAKKTGHGEVIAFPWWRRLAPVGIAAAAMVVAAIGLQLQFRGEPDTGSSEPEAVEPAGVRQDADVVQTRSQVEPPAKPADKVQPDRSSLREEVRQRMFLGQQVAAPMMAADRRANGLAASSLPAGGGMESGIPLWGPSLDDYDEIRDNTFRRVADHPLSTFSIDVDTASYAQVRKMLLDGVFPPADAVRVEEMINYFPYAYAPPTGAHPFAAHMEIAACPWNPAHQLVRIGLKGRELALDKRPALNLVYLVDVSGSMNAPNKLPLVKRSLQTLVRQLDGRDRVSIVVYAGAAGLVLPPTSGGDGQAILDALEKLQAGGGTDGGSGIRLAYATAREYLDSEGVNRVILCTDGDFNVGVTQRGDLVRMIEREAEDGIFLTVLGFGMGNYKDSALEELSNRGNGTYAYINDFSEARKVLVEEMLGTLVTIAKDVKIQVEFNPAAVAGYRLIGYENRMLNKEDFNDDTVDAGDIGAGHTVTAFYELVPAGAPVPGDAPGVDPLKYRAEETLSGDAAERLTLKLRYKLPDGDTSTRLDIPLANRDPEGEPSGDYRFAAAVAAFGQRLRGNEHLGDYGYDEILAAARGALGADPHGYRAEFLKLVANAKALDGSRAMD